MRCYRHGSVNFQRFLRPGKFAKSLDPYQARQPAAVHLLKYSQLSSYKLTDNGERAAFFIRCFFFFCVFNCFKAHQLNLLWLYDHDEKSYERFVLFHVIAFFLKLFELQ